MEDKKKTKAQLLKEIQEMRRISTMYHYIVDNLQEGIVLTIPDGTFMEFNPALACIHGRPIFDGEGKVAYYISNIEDVIESKQAEEALLKENEALKFKMRELVDAIKKLEALVV